MEPKVALPNLIPITHCHKNNEISIILIVQSSSHI
jgi:hypothetical protein